MIAASFSLIEGLVRRLAAFAACLALAVSGMIASATTASADLRLCNMTGSRVGAAIGYRDTEVLEDEGTGVESRNSHHPEQCETYLRRAASTPRF